MIKIKVPATTANMGPGFDSFGLALSLYNIVTVSPNKSGSITVENIGESYRSLDDPAHNLVTVAAQKLFNRVGYQPEGLHFVLENNIPVSRGLGSSAAGIVGGLLAANVLVGNLLTLKQLVDMAVDIEGHPDNVCPALFGGFTISCRNKDGEVLVFPDQAPDVLKYIVAIPDFHLSTRVSREVLPKEVSLSDAVYNIQCASILVGALLRQKLELLTHVVDDRLHQGYRLPLIKGGAEVVAAARQAGALAAAISGSGPTLIAFADKDEQKIATAMREAWQAVGVKPRVLVLTQDSAGAHVL